jgi:hypothetical protein
VDTGTSSSLINKEIVEFSSFTMKISKKHTKWVTQAGTFQTERVSELENHFFPQFTTKRKISSSYHMFQKNPKDTYDLIMGGDILEAEGFNSLYESNKFM